MPQSLRDYGRLTALAFLIGLVSTRVGLVVHELAGHALPAAMIGSDVTGYHLFWFGGGYVSYARAEPFSLAEGLFVSLAGLGLELIIGGLCLWWARRLERGSVAQLVILGFGTGHLLHALHYLAGGSFHGYGDPWLLYRELTGARVYVAGGLAVVLCGLAFVLARAIAGRLREQLGAHRPMVQRAIVVGAVATAGLLHATLAFGEQALTPNRTYAATFKSVSQRKVEVGVKRYQRIVTRRRGSAPSKAELARVRRALKKQHATFPFMPVMSLCLVIAVIGGVIAARPRAAPEPDGATALPSLSAQRWLAAGALGSMLLIAVLKALS